jgi:hypothetical protein
MSSWREKIWVKITALTIAGVFLFSEVTWAARADFTFSLPKIDSSTPAQTTSSPRLGDSLWQILQELTSFLLPAAHAKGIDDVTFYNNKRYNTMPVLDPNATWKKSAEAVVLPED